MKRVSLIFLCLILIFCLTACSGNNSTNNNSPISSNGSPNSSCLDNLVSYDNVNYRVNPILDSSDDIDYVDFEESNGMTCVEFCWNYFSNDDGEGCKDVLIMYYDDSLSNVQSGEQSILGSVYCHRNDDMTTEWLYFGAENNLIYKNNDGLEYYDENDNLIATLTEDGSSCYDLNGNEFDINSLDPFLEILNSFEN